MDPLNVLPISAKFDEMPFVSFFEIWEKKQALP